MGLILFGASDSNAADKVWPGLLGGVIVGCTADGYTSYVAGQNPRLREANPLYAWAGPEGGAGLRLGVGALTVYGLHQIHKTHPKTAKTLAIIAIGTSLGAAYHNRQVIREFD